jgi:creatinine amidohydrolase
VAWARLTAPELRALARPETVVVIPVASVEQHGPHLATGVDMVLATGVAARTARRLWRRARSPAPALHLDRLAEHHMEFGGTVTLDLDVFMGVLRGAARSVARHGFPAHRAAERHGGNTEAVRDVGHRADARARRARRRPDLLARQCRHLRAILETQPNVQHACGGRDLHDDGPRPGGRAGGADRGGRPTPRGAAAPPGFRRSRPFARMTDTGVIGDPRAASREKASAAGRRRARLARNWRGELWD